MTGNEFRAARIAAGLSYRQAALKLGVSTRTVQLWEMKGADVVPVRGEAISADVSQGAAIAYVIGRIAAVVESATGKPLPLAMRKAASSGAGLAALLGAYHAQGVDRRATEGRVAELMAQLPATIAVGPADAVSFELGFYHEKAGVP